MSSGCQELKSLCAAAALNCNITTSASLECLLAPGKDKDFFFHLNKKMHLLQIISIRNSSESPQLTTLQYVWGNGDWWSLLLCLRNPLCRKVYEDGGILLTFIYCGMSGPDPGWKQSVSTCAVTSTWNSGNEQKPSPSPVVCRNLGVLQDYKQLVPKIICATDI